MEIPPNTSATVYVPAGSIEAITENGLAVTSSKNIVAAGKEKDYVIFKIGSGKYHFEVKR